MKRVLLGVAILGTAAFLGGCPIYPNTSSQFGGSGEYQVCTANACYSCPSDTYTSACIPVACRSDADCTSGYVCAYTQAAGQTCTLGGSGSSSGGSSGSSSGSGSVCNTPTECPNGSTCGQDGTCHAGDCGQAGVGCVSGYVCRLAGGQARCVDLGDGGSEPDTAAPETGTGDDATTGDDGSSGDDASAGEGGSETSTTPDASSLPDAAGAPPCNADSQCADSGTGAKCIDGRCEPQVALCSDTTQCVVPGFACVDGVCEPRCTANSPCPTGYSCDLPRGVCNINPSPCGSSSSCQGGTTCVEQHCVPPCAVGETGTSCPAGQVCVNGGCIPDQAAKLTCTNDGQSNLLANQCSSTSVCLHHDCYTECSVVDGGGCTDPAFPVCKAVTIETGTYGACATATNLGSDCDPAQGKLPPGCGVCIDGYCR